MRSEKITFDGTQGELAARLDLPTGKPLAYALFAHCFTCSKDVLAASRIARELARNGIATLRFDFTGLGGSEGEFGNTNFTSNIKDLVKAAEFLEEDYEAPQLLIGHSLGGAAVLAAAGEISSAKAVATIGAPFDPGHVARHFAEHLDDIKSSGEADVAIAGRTFTVTKQFLDDIDSQDQKDRIASMKKALLIFHAPLDEVVSIDNAGNIFTTAKHPKSFITLDGADHMLSDPEDAAYVGHIIKAWTSRYLDLPDFRALKGPFAPSPDHVVVEESGTGRFTQLVNANEHELLADEPFDYGGDNLGPTPYGFLLSALGACTAMTMRLYAEKKGLSLKHVSVKLSHEKVHAKDCKDCENKNGKIDEIRREIAISGDLSDDEEAKLLEIADKCPVHRTLHSEVKIRTRKVD